MTHNLALGPEADAAHALSLLRATPSVGPLISGAPIVPGIFVALDPESSTEAEAIGVPGALLGLTIRSAVPGRWAGLHIALGGIGLSNKHIIGFVLRSQAPSVTVMRAALRSGRPGGFDDLFFPKQIVAFGEDSTHVDLIQLARHPDFVPPEAPWRELVLFMPPDGCTVILQDLRLFIV